MGKTRAMEEKPDSHVVLKGQEGPDPETFLL